MITVPGNKTLYKYSFRIRGKKELYAGEFVSDSFWNADRLLASIIHSYNEMEWIKDPGIYGANLIHEVKLSPVGKDDPKEIITDNKEYDEEALNLVEYDKWCQRTTCAFGIIVMLIIIFIGVFGEDIIRKLIP